MVQTTIRRAFFDLSEKDVDDAERSALVRRYGFGDTSDWDDVLKSRLVLLISEAQSGKTYECQAQQRRLWDAGDAAFFVDLSTLASQSWRDLRSAAETDHLVVKIIRLVPNCPRLQTTDIGWIPA